MSDSKFKKNKEDFVCEKCSFAVEGNGYTNHCPKCLYSKHVDIFPGDRAEKCGGLMEPTLASESGGEWSILHKCQKCGKTSNNIVSKDDDFDEMIKISINKFY